MGHARSDLPAISQKQRELRSSSLARHHRAHPQPTPTMTMPCPNPPRGVRPPDCCAFTKQSGMVPGASPHPGLRLDEADFGVVRSPSRERANHPIFADQVRLPSTQVHLSPPPRRVFGRRLPPVAPPTIAQPPLQQCRRAAVPQPSPAVSGVAFGRWPPNPPFRRRFCPEALLSAWPLSRHLWDRASTVPLPLLPERPFPQPAPVIARVACDLSSERSLTHKKGWSPPLNCTGPSLTPCSFTDHEQVRKIVPIFPPSPTMAFCSLPLQFSGEWRQ